MANVPNPRTQYEATLAKGGAESDADYEERLRKEALKQYDGSVEARAKHSLADGKVTEKETELNGVRGQLGEANKKKNILAGVAMVVAILSLIFLGLWLNAPGSSEIQAAVNKAKLDWREKELAPVEAERAKVKAERDRLAAENSAFTKKVDTAESQALQCAADLKQLQDSPPRCESVTASVQGRRATSRRASSVATGRSAVTENVAYGASFGGCGVKLAGVTFKELQPRANSTCLRDREIIVRKFKAQCWGKTGSDAGDRACGARLTLD